MIYVFVGNDQQKKLEAREALAQSFLGREAFFVNDANFDPEIFQNYLSGGDLFSKKYFITLDSVISSDFGDEILDRAEQMSDSETIFVILEPALLKAPTETLKKYAKEFKTFDLPKSRDEKFNIFSITDAFGARDKKNTWVLMQKAIISGIAAEEILNILIWQAKNLLFVSRGDDMKSTGLSPFVYNKSKSYARNYKMEELEDISRAFISMFHESHLGLDLEPNLEKYLLKTL
jgi:DNA polymerase III delta subunit